MVAAGENCQIHPIRYRACGRKDSSDRGKGVERTFNCKFWLVPHLSNLRSCQQSHASLLYQLPEKLNCYILDNPSTHLIPGEVSVVLVDQIFLDPEIIVAGWKEQDLLMWGVVTIPKARFNRIPRYPSKLFRDTFNKAAKAGGCANYCVAPLLLTLVELSS